MGLFGDDDLDRRRRLVESTALTQVGRIAPDDGLVAVQGTVRVHEETVGHPVADATVLEPSSDGDRRTRPSESRGPAEADDGRRDVEGRPSVAEDDRTTPDGGSGTASTTLTGDTDTGDTRSAPERGPAVLVTHAVRSRDGDETTGTERTVEAVPFVVEDDTGRALVDVGNPSDARGVLLSAGASRRYLGDETGSRLVPTTGGEGTREIARARTALGSTPECVHEFGTLCSGDRVYVLGQVDPRDGDPGEVIGVPDDPREFVVSDLSRSALAEALSREGGGLGRRFWLFVLLGLIVAVMLLITVAALLDSFVL